MSNPTLPLQRLRDATDAGFGLSSLAVEGVENSAYVASGWIRDRISHLADSSEKDWDVTSGLLGDGVSTSDLEYWVDNISTCCADGRIIQYELIDGSQSYQKTLRVWVGESYDDIPITQSGQDWIVDPLAAQAAAQRNKLQNVRDIVADTAAEGIEYLSTMDTAIAALINDPNAQVTTLFPQTVGATSHCKEMIDLIAHTPSSQRKNVLLQYFLGTLDANYQALNDAVNEDQDAGAFDPGVYQNFKTASVLQGTWSLIGQGFTAIGSLLMIMGETVTKFIGFGLTAAGYVINALNHVATSGERFTVASQADTLAFADAVRFNLAGSPSVQPSCTVSTPDGKTFGSINGSGMRISNQYSDVMTSKSTTYNPSGWEYPISGLIYPRAANLMLSSPEVSDWLAYASQTATYQRAAIIDRGLEFSFRDRVHPSVAESALPSVLMNNHMNLRLGPMVERSSTAIADSSAVQAELLNRLAHKGSYYWTDVSNFSDADERLRQNIFANYLVSMFSLATAARECHRRKVAPGNGRYDFMSVLIPSVDDQHYSAMESFGLLLGFHDVNGRYARIEDSIPELTSFTQNWNGYHTLFWDYLTNKFFGSTQSDPLQAWLGYLPYYIATGGSLKPFSSCTAPSWPKLTALFEDDFTMKMFNDFSQYYQGPNVAPYVTYKQMFAAWRYGYVVSSVELSIHDVLYAFFCTGLDYIYGVTSDELTQFISSPSNANEGGAVQVMNLNPQRYNNFQGVTNEAGFCMTPFVTYDYSPRAITNPLVTPPSYAPGTALATAIVGAVATITTAVVSLAVYTKVRKWMKTRVIRLEKEAKDATARLENVDPTSPRYNEIANDYIKAQRRFQRAAGFVGYSSNSVGSFGSGFAPQMLYSSATTLSQWATDTALPQLQSIDAIVQDEEDYDVILDAIKGPQ